MQDPYNSDDYGDDYDNCDDNASIIHCKPNSYAIANYMIYYIYCLIEPKSGLYNKRFKRIAFHASDAFIHLKWLNFQTSMAWVLATRAQQ